MNHLRPRPHALLKRLLIRSSGRAPRTCVLGLYRGLRLHLDLHTDTSVWLGLWERETHAWIRRAAERCRWAVDVGAGHGELCVYLLWHSRAEVIHALEPQAAAREVFQANLCLAGSGAVPRVRVYDHFAGARPGPRRLTLDALAIDRGTPGFVKIDVDGPECEVLDGARRLLGEADVCLLVETHSLELERGCIERLQNLGYRSTVIPNAWWRVLIPEHRPIEHNRWLWATRA